jgi:hypothetical protein
MKAIRQFKFTQKELRDVLIREVKSVRPEMQLKDYDVKVLLDGDNLASQGVDGSKVIITIEVDDF